MLACETYEINFVVRVNITVPTCFNWFLVQQQQPLDVSHVYPVNHSNTFLSIVHIYKSPLHYCASFSPFCCWGPTDMHWYAVNSLITFSNSDLTLLWPLRAAGLPKPHHNNYIPVSAKSWNTHSLMRCVWNRYHLLNHQPKQYLPSNEDKYNS